MKKCCAILVLLALLLCGAALAEDSYRLLRVGNNGDDVLAMKERLYALGYYTTTKFNDSYTDAVSDVVGRFQHNNGLEENGVADAYTQAVLFSGAAVKADGAVYEPGAALPGAGAGGEGSYRELRQGAQGDDVTAVKDALYTLKLYSNKNYNDQFNAAMTERVIKYQTQNGLAGDGIVTPALQALLHQAAPTATPRPTATPKPTRTPKPTVAPVEAVALPELDEEGFLADAQAAPFVHESFADGHWYYIDDELHIEICRYSDPNFPLVWYETEIICKESVTFSALLASGSREPGHNFQDPMTIADKGKAILAFTDDNYGYRWYRRTVAKKNQYQTGAVIRDGEIKSASKPNESYNDFPPLDVMAYYPDGRAEMYYAEEYDAQELLDMGVLHTLTFGPILIKDGEVDQRIYNSGKAVLEEQYFYPEPRQAIGYCAPGHYKLLTVKGRADDSAGVTVEWLALKMKEMGVESAINLDGGYTTVLYFMGEAVNKKANVKRTGLREVSSVIGVGVLDE